jgi:hypothetical protein
LPQRPRAVRSARVRAAACGPRWPEMEAMDRTVDVVDEARLRSVAERR